MLLGNSAVAQHSMPSGTTNFILLELSKRART